MKVRRPFLLLFVLALVVAAYYPVIFAEVCSVDDQKMLEGIKGMSDVSLNSLFFPGGANGWYYRPLIGATFFGDRYLHGLNTQFMHLFNILLQLLNTLLVYAVTLLLTPAEKRRDSLVPVVAAAIFGLHPLATESVSWLSGRTDLLAGFFLLLSVTLLLKFRENGKWLFTLGAFAALLSALLAKESAAAFLPGFLLLLICRAPGRSADPVNNRCSLSLFTRIMICIGAIAVGIRGIIFIRSLVFHSSANNMSWTVKFMLNDLTHTLFVCLGGVGFYLKKMVIPWPLNFAIVEIDPLYELLGMGVVGITFWVLSRNSLRASLWVAGVILLAPSFLIAFNQIAWTPYAERYAYLPLALMAPAFISWFFESVGKKSRRTAVLPTLLLLLIFGGSVFARSVTWSSNFALIRDTAQVSPSAPGIKGLYVLKLIEQERFAEAERHAGELKKLTSVGYDPRSDAIMSYLLMKKGSSVQALAQLKALTSRKSDYDLFVTNLLLDVIEEASIRRELSVTAIVTPEEIGRYGDVIFNSSHDYFIYYRLGKIFNRLRLPDDARVMFTKAVNVMPSTDPLRPIIQRHIPVNP